LCVSGAAARQSLTSYISRQEEGTTILFVCTICGKANTYKGNTLNHVESVHFPCFEYRCPYCGVTYKSKNAYNVHISRQHKERRKN
jgi:uncharacterized C2H2 Zn-finger protein